MNAETWVIVVWTIGLVGALPPTLVILKEASLVVSTLADIHGLALRTAEAARGIAANLEGTSNLPALAGLGEPLMRASDRLGAAAPALADAVDRMLGPSVIERLGRRVAEWLARRRS